MTGRFREAIFEGLSHKKRDEERRKDDLLNSKGRKEKPDKWHEGKTKEVDLGVFRSGRAD